MNRIDYQTVEVSRWRDLRRISILKALVLLVALAIFLVFVASELCGINYNGYGFAVVRAVVVDSKTGAAIAGADVKIECEERLIGKGKTGSDGSVVLNVRLPACGTRTWFRETTNPNPRIHFDVAQSNYKRFEMEGVDESSGGGRVLWFNLTTATLVAHIKLEALR